MRCSDARVFFERDIYAYWVPAVEAFVRAIAEGAWPLWDPLTNFGRPLLADPSMQIAYPPTWLNLVLPPGAYYTLFVVSHCAWAGLGTLLLAARGGSARPPRAWAAASWMLSGPFLSAASLYHHFASAAWMAWVLLALERVIERPGGRSAAWLAAAAAGMALAGSADICVMTGGGGAGPRRLRARRRGEERARLAPAALARRPRRCVRAGRAALRRPVVAHARAPRRRQPRRRRSGREHVLVGASREPARRRLPGPRGRDAPGEAWRAAVFEGRGPLLRSLYVGIPAVVLAVVALFGRWRLRWLVAGLAAAFLIGALGRFTPVYPALAGLPVVRLLRFPVKLALPATLFLCLLSGAGIDALRQEWTERQRRWMILLAVAVAVVAVGGACGAAAAPRIAAALAPSLAPSPPAEVPDRLRSAFVRAAVLSAVAAGALVLRAARGPATRVLAAALALAVLDLFAAARGDDPPRAGGAAAPPAAAARCVSPTPGGTASIRSSTGSGGSTSSSRGRPRDGTRSGRGRSATRSGWRLPSRRAGGSRAASTATSPASPRSRWSG